VEHLTSLNQPLVAEQMEIKSKTNQSQREQVVLD